MVLVWQWRDWPSPELEPDAEGLGTASVEESAQPEQNPLDLLTPLGEKEEYAVVTERPLFLPGRRPPVEEPPEEAPPEPEQISDLARLDLNAVLITPAESSAWVRDPSNKELVKLRLGDDLAGWTVKEILTDRLLLERQGETDTLILRDYKNMPPPVPPRRKPVARNPREQAPQKAAKQPPRQAAKQAPREATGQPAAVKRPNPRQPAGSRQDALQQPPARNLRTRPNARNPQQQRQVQE
jgi:hypothetical protein